MGLHSFPGSCLVWSDPALGSMGSMAGLKSNSKTVYTKGDCPSLPLPVPPSPWWAPASTGGSFGSVSCGVTAAFLWVLVHARFCLYPPRWESLFLPVLWPFRADSLGIPSSFVSPQAEEAWHEVQNLHSSGRTSSVLLFSSWWVTHPVGIGLI